MSGGDTAPPSVPGMAASSMPPISESPGQLVSGGNEDIMKELCTINGVSYDKLPTEGAGVENLESFFSGFPRLISLAPFPNLTRLCIMGQRELAKIEGIATLVRLKELWVAECAVKRIEGLGTLERLEQLFLYDNQIGVITGLDTLVDLHTLDLSTNQISTIQNLAGLVNLRQLNLAANKIEKLGRQILYHPDLAILNLSGNLIGSLKAITCLQGLPALKHLSFGDPKYAPNPVCHLCNYATHILHHLPGLKGLDEHDVQAKPLKDLSESTVVKKKMYYTMRLKVLKKRLALLTKKMGEYKTGHLTKDLTNRLRQLWSALKMVEKALEDAADGNKPESEKKAVIDLLNIKKEAILSRIKQCDQQCAKYEEFMQARLSQAKQSFSSQSNRLIMELDSVGNIRFEDGGPKDIWFTSCHELLLSRFCARDYREAGVQGIRVNRVTRVYNRALRLRFDEKVAQISASNGLVESMSYRPPNVKSQLEYLFWVWDPLQVGSADDVSSIIEDGFHGPEVLKTLDRAEAVHLSTAVSLADKLRIAKICQTQPEEVARGRCPFRHGKLIIVKAFIGQSVAAAPRGPISRKTYPKATAVYQSRQESPLGGLFSTGARRAGGGGGDTSCDCKDRQVDWYIFDKELVVPEYYVDFEYVTQSSDTNPFSIFDCVLLEAPSQGLPRTVSSDSDSDVLDMKPAVTSKTRVTSLREDVILNLCQAPSLLHINELNLHNNGLTSLSGIRELAHLKKLYVSFNDIQRLDDLTNMKLIYLDCSFNKIYTLDGIKNLAYLKYMDVSWNMLRYIRDEIAIIRKHAPIVEELRIANNLWLKPVDLRLRVISRLKSLQVLDGKRIEEGESAAALRLMAGSRVSQVSLMSSARCDSSRPRTLSLQSTAQVLHRLSPHKLDRMGEQDLAWMAKVTSLCLDSQHLGKLSNLERLENLRWASFCHNDIVKMEGLECCRKLEELCLEGNCIYRLEGIGSLINLRRLNLSDNFLTVIDSGQFDRLTHLHYLSIDHNKLSSLCGLQKATGLMELYAHQNRIGNQQDIFYLKSIPSLAVCDLGNNPICQSNEHYRMYVVYHLSQLKALDGAPVEPSELSQAKELYGGRLTADFVVERLGLTRFEEMRELEFPHCAIRHVDLGSGHQFTNLRSVNLEHNSLLNFGGLVNLVNLRVLCLNHNHIESLFPRPKVTGSGPASQLSQQQWETSMNSTTPVLESLEVLHLGYNGIKDLVPLQLSRIINLKALFLQGNEIQIVTGLEGLRELRELVLDKNKIKTVGPGALATHWSLEELHLEENRIRGELGPALEPLANLQRLYLGMNRIQDLAEMEALQPLTKLVEFSVVSNPVSRRLLHRPLLVHKMPSLTVIDGIHVTEEERIRADMAYLQQEQQIQQQDIPGILPGIQQGSLLKSQVKVTNVSLGSFIERVPWSGTLQYDPATLQSIAEAQRMRRSGGPAPAPTQPPSHGNNPFAKSNGPPPQPNGQGGASNGASAKAYQELYNGPFHNRPGGKK